MNDKETVGIWTRVIGNKDKTFYRDQSYNNEYINWAKINKIVPKSDKYRIILIGESVARGYLYDPYINPSKVLENILNKNLQGDIVEVIDLARTNLTLNQLTALCKQSVLLEPDEIVVYAGNNWIFGLHELNEGILKDVPNSQEDLIIALKEASNYTLKNSIDIFLETIHEYYYKNNIPVVLLIPGVNLADWKHNMGHELFPFRTDVAQECHMLKNKIGMAIEKNNIEINDIERLISLSPYNSIGYEYKAHILHLENNYNGAVKLYQMAHDTDTYMPNRVPGCTAFCRELILSKAALYGMDVLDLQKEFQKDFPTQYASNYIYIDYCHLSYIGMHYAMFYTAKKLIMHITGNKIMPEIKYIEVDPIIISKAHLFAAIHCAHRGNQSYKLLYYHCEKALEASLEIVQYMLDYMHLVTCNLPWELNKHFKSIFMDNLIDQYPNLIENSRHKTMDILLVDAMVALLKSKGYDYSKLIHDLRLSERAPQCGEIINLLEPQHLRESFATSDYFRKLSDIDGKKTAFFRIIDHVTKFYFIADSTNDLNFYINIRKNKAIKKAELNIHINDTLVYHMPISQKWRDGKFSVSRELLFSDTIQNATVTIFTDNCIITDFIDSNCNEKDHILKMLKPFYCDVMFFQFGII